jgi:hypothetical protein
MEHLEENIAINPSYEETNGDIIDWNNVTDVNFCAAILSSVCDISPSTNKNDLPSIATFLSDFNTATQLPAVMFQCIA